jgi:hypothetical protein
MSSSDICSIVVVAGFAPLCLILAIITYIVSNRRQKRRAAERAANLSRRLEAEYKKWSTSVVINNGLKPIAADLCLQKGEQCFFADSAVLYEPVATRRSTHLGGGVRVARGVVIGGGGTISKSHDEWRELSSGTFYITNKRIFFDGDMHDRTIKMSALTSVQATLDEVAISSSTRQKTMVFSGINARIVKDTIRLIQRVNNK